MKPSGTGLFFVVRFFITDSISLLVISLFRFSILVDCVVSRNVSISSRISNLLTYNCLQHILFSLGFEIAIHADSDLCYLFLPLSFLTILCLFSLPLLFYFSFFSLSDLSLIFPLTSPVIPSLPFRLPLINLHRAPLTGPGARRHCLHVLQYKDRRWSALFWTRCHAPDTFGLNFWEWRRRKRRTV